MERRNDGMEVLGGNNGVASVQEGMVVLRVLKGGTGGIEGVQRKK